MKTRIYIKSMSIAQSDIENKMKARRKKVAEHVAKCAMYGDGLGEGKYNNWIEHELATWISEINDLTAKPRGKKLKPQKYSNLLFGLLGDEPADSKSALIDLQIYNSGKRNPYPEVDIDKDMIKRLYSITKQLNTKVVPLLSTNNKMSKKDIEGILHGIFDPICKGIEIW